MIYLASVDVVHTGEGKVFARAPESRLVGLAAVGHVDLRTWPSGHTHRVLTSGVSTTTHSGLAADFLLQRDPSRLRQPLNVDSGAGRD